jgi:hypothetical protein
MTSNSRRRHGYREPGPHAYSGSGRTCSPRFSHIRIIFAPYSHHIRTIFAHIRTVFAPHSHHIRPLRDGHVWTCLDMAGHGWTCLMDMAGHGWTWLDMAGHGWKAACLRAGPYFMGDRTRFVRFAPDSRDSHHIRTAFALYSHHIRTYSRVFAEGSQCVHTHSHTFTHIHTHSHM